MIAETDTSPRPLDGLRVLDATHIVAGPFCAMLLADMGAEVIKIERTKVGERARLNDPFVQSEDGRRVSARFLAINRNKKSVTLDLRQPRGKEIFENLIKASDVLLDNWGPGALQRLNLGFDHLRQLNPGLIYASITGFGDSDGLRGPYSDWPANNPCVQGMGGWMEITGAPDARRRWWATTSATPSPASGPPWALCWLWNSAAKPGAASIWIWQCTIVW